MMEEAGEDTIVKGYKQCVRAAMFRILSIAPSEETDQTFCKLLHGDAIKQSALMELTNAEIKSDNQYFILLNLMYDLCLWCLENREIRNQLRKGNPNIGISIVEFIVVRSIKLLSHDKKHYTMVSRQNQLSQILLEMFPLFLPILSLYEPQGEQSPILKTEITLNKFEQLYTNLRDPKEYHPSNIRAEQKRTFLKSIDNCLSSISKAIAQSYSSQSQEFIAATIKSSYDILQFLHQNASTEIYRTLSLPLDEGVQEILISRFKVIKKIITTLRNIRTTSQSQISRVDYNSRILHGTAHLLIETTSNKFLSNLHLVGACFSVYEEIMPLLIEKESMVPLYLFANVVLNNLKKLMGDEEKTASSNGTSEKNVAGRFVILETILSQVSRIFQKQYLTYFLKLYDWNFMEEDICLEAIKILYEFIEDTSNEKKVEYEMYKKHIVQINKGIQQFLSHYERIHQGVQKSGLLKERKQFYELKKKQYLEIVKKINNKPKDIFKAVEAMADKEDEFQEQYIQKCVRILKKSKHIDPKAMINVVSAGNKVSEIILEKYLDSVMKKVENISLEEFIRFLISNFFLWGEAQQIQRVLDKLTVYYYSHNPVSAAIFKNSDVVYTFANAIIILNTDQHNPKNENKMSEEAFLKMCKKINDNEDLPEEIVKQTFKNIRENQIFTHRDRYKMQGISLENWMVMVSDNSSVNIGYYDEDMRDMEQVQINNLADQSSQSFSSGFSAYAYELLVAVIDEKQTQKLELMVERFEYDEKKFDCEIIEKIRGMVESKPHVAMHVLQKVFESAQFQQKKKVDDKMLSYFWLAANIIDSFSAHIPFSKVSQFLLSTWRIRFELRDSLHIRQHSEMVKMRKMLKQFKKKESKKSIMDMFSKFLSSKDSDHEEEETVSPNSSIVKKKNHLLNYSNQILSILMKNQEGRARAAESILLSIRCEEARRFEEFVACLFLIFYLTNGQNGTTRNDCLQICLHLLEQIFGITESHISTRITNLKTKAFDKYEQIIGMCQYWGLKVLLNWHVRVHQNLQEDKSHKKYDKLRVKIDAVLTKCSEIVPKLNKETYEEVLSLIEVHNCSYQALSKSMMLPESFLKLLHASGTSMGINKSFLVKDESNTEELIPKESAEQSQGQTAKLKENTEQENKENKEKEMQEPILREEQISLPKKEPKPVENDLQKQDKEAVSEEKKPDQFQKQEEKAEQKITSNEKNQSENQQVRKREEAKESENNVEENNTQQKTEQQNKPNKDTKEEIVDESDEEDIEYIMKKELGVLDAEAEALHREKKLRKQQSRENVDQPKTDKAEETGQEETTKSEGNNSNNSGNAEEVGFPVYML